MRRGTYGGGWAAAHIEVFDVKGAVVLFIGWKQITQWVTYGFYV